MDFNKLLKQDQIANEYVNKLKTEDDMIEIKNIISSMDIDTMKRVLGKFVYEAHE